MVTKNNFLIILTITIFYVESIIARSSHSIIKLSHPISPHSPFHNPNLTKIDMINASKARFNFIKARTRNMTGRNTDSYRVPVFPFSDNLGFLANVSIGTPSVSQYLVMDTGSSFTWVQDEGCVECKEQLGPKYDPALSTSVDFLDCPSKQCDLVPSHRCDANEFCTYSIKYADGSMSSGLAVNETFTFIDRSTAPDVIIGCGIQNNAGTEKDSGGILGLGGGAESISSHLGSMFSYCVGNLNDPEPEHHFLIIGRDAIMLGGPSPLTVQNGFYYVSLEGIAVGNVNLDINPEVFKLKADNTGGVIIDSGAAYTYLVAPAYEALKAEVAWLIDDTPIPDLPGYPNMLCYNGWAKTAVPRFLSVTLKFAGGQSLRAGADTLFIQMNAGVFCLSFDVHEGSDMPSLIGIFAQQFYNVGHDLRGGTIHFQPALCEGLAEESYL